MSDISEEKKINNTLSPVYFLSRSSDQKYWSWERSCCQPSAHRLESLEESSIWGGEFPQLSPMLLQLWLNKISTSMNVRQMQRQRFFQEPTLTAIQPTGNILRVCVRSWAFVWPPALVRQTMNVTWSLTRTAQNTVYKSQDTLHRSHGDETIQMQDLK